MDEKLMSIKEVKDITTLSHTTIYKLIKRGEFPAPLKITGKSSAWLYSEIIEWIDRLKVARGA